MSAEIECIQISSSSFHRFVKLYVMFLMFMSCFIFSIHFFGCLPWFLRPVMEQCIISTGSRSLPILDTCPNHVSLRCAILSTNLLSWCRVLHTHSSSRRALSPATIFLAISSLPLEFCVHFPFSDTSIPSRTTLLELQRFHTTSL